MNHLFEKNTVDTILKRIDSLTPNSQRQWGKMEVAQMMAHCIVALETATGQRKLPRMFIGRVLGPLFKSKFYNEQPFDKNSPTGKDFIITDQRDFEKEKESLKTIVQQFATAGPENCTSHPHSFFGSLTPEQWSIGIYKHLDHHLRQFGA